MKGFQLFFEAFKSQLTSKLDAVLATVHFMLIQEDFLCLGVGETFEEGDAADLGTEELPTGWNADNANVYLLKYRSRNGDKLKLLLKGIVVGEHFIVSAVPLNASEVVHSVNIQTDLYLTDKWNSSYSEAFVSGHVKPLEDVLRRHLLMNLRETASGASGSGLEQKSDQESKSCMEKRCVPPNTGRDAQEHRNNDLFQLPRIVDPSELNIFNRRQDGGMDPIAQNLPPGAVPPGVRFDPFAPPLPNNPNDPKGGGGGASGGFPPPDHLPPPGGPDSFI